MCHGLIDVAQFIRFFKDLLINITIVPPSNMKHTKSFLEKWTMQEALLSIEIKLYYFFNDWSSIHAIDSMDLFPTNENNNE